MKLNKLFLLSGLAALTLGMASCSKDDDVSAGPEAGSYNVVFTEESNQALELTATEFTLSLARLDSLGGAITVPIQVVKKADVLTVPESITFEDGETEKNLTIQISEAAEAFVDYQLILTIPNEYAGGTYKEQDTYGRIEISIHKEDYKAWGTMTYYSWFWEEAWDSDVFYSEYMGMYRCDIFTEGYPFYFKINEDGELTICGSDGVKKTDTLIGYEHPTYGAMFVRWADSYYTGWDEDEDGSNGAYYVPFAYRVSAGSFGTDYDSFILTKAE